MADAVRPGSGDVVNRPELAFSGRLEGLLPGRFAAGWQHDQSWPVPDVGNTCFQALQAEPSRNAG